MNEAIHILESLAGKGVTIWPEGSRIRFRAAKGALTEDLKKLLAANKVRFLPAWRERAASQIESYPAIHSQRALWFLYPGSAG